MTIQLALTLGLLTGPAAWGADGVVVADEVSVRPGINESYIKPDLNVSNAVERFEREGREVYDHRMAILKVVGLEPGADIADIGAGTGLFTLLFAGAVGPQGTVYAVDIAEPFVRHVEVQARERGIGNVKGVVCTDRSVGLPGDSIDVAFLCDTYHHFEYPQSTLASLRQALRPGGQVVIVDFKRIPGESSEWVLDHVRAGQETTEAEMIRAGFEKMEDVPLLKETYIVRFRSGRR